MISFAKQNCGHRIREQIYGHQEERRKGGMNWGNGINIHILLCIKQKTNENLLYSTGNTSYCSVVTEVGRKSNREEIHAYTQLIHSATQHKLAPH